MIRHIVMWRLKESAAGASRTENAEQIKQQLEALAGRVPGLLHVEVGVNFEPGSDASDVVLCADFVDRAALARYQAHPEHAALKPFMAEVRAERRVVDYEI